MAPNDYRDPFWRDLAGSVETKLELPKGLLAAIITRGERSNNDAVSEAGAKTPFQIIPATRKAAIDKWGIDPYLSPENAAEVGGLLLKDSLKRNKGDATLAVAEYHGGTDRSNWGPRTKSYVARVTGSAPDISTLREAAPEKPAASTFERVSAALSKPDESAISNVYAAYQSGQMPATDAKQFEDDVNAGHIMLPRGAALKAATPAAANSLPPGVVKAYTDGTMDPADRAQLEADVKAGIVSMPGGPLRTGAAAIPTDGTPPSAPPAAPGTVDTAIGTGEAALSTVTGLTGGAIGAAGGLIGGLAGAVMNGQFGTPQGAAGVEQAMAEGAQSLTYQPRTASGQAQAGAVGSVLQAALPIAPLTAEMGALGAGARPVGMAAADAARAIPRPSTRMVPVAAPTSGTMGSVGAAAADIATQRRATAADLPVPIDLTKGQATRGADQVRFEQETAKGPQGEPIRQHMAEQNARMAQNFDAFVDATGAEAADLISAGRAVTGVIAKKAARDKTEIRVAYKEAEKAGELEAPVSTDALVKVLNESRSAESTAPVLKAARDELIRLGGAAADDAGLLTPGEMTLGNVEQVRKFVNKTTGIDPTNQKFAGDIKGAIDTLTEGAGGELYNYARSLHRRYQQQYVNHALISDLLTNRRGTVDRKVALEDVFRRSVLQGSREDAGYLRRVLQTEGPEGHQAWKEIQGATMRHIRDTAMGNVATDIRGNPIVSAAKLNNVVKTLDSDGKLDFVFGKRGAQQVRDLNEIAKVVYTMPPGTVNTSNTASVLLAALGEAGAWGGATGLPVPVLTGLRQLAKHVKDRAVQKRITDALAQAKSRPQKMTP